MTKDSSEYLGGFASGFSASAAFSAAVLDGACSACFDCGGVEFWAGGAEPGGKVGCWEFALAISTQAMKTMRRRSRIVNFWRGPSHYPTWKSIREGIAIRFRLPQKHSPLEIGAGMLGPDGLEVLGVSIVLSSYDK